MAKKLAPFLDKYNLILFDMDGVITSEQCYWDSSALAIFELMHEGEDIDVNYLMDNFSSIRNNFFCNDKTISLLKERGVNSNWDLTYVVYGVAKMLKTDNFEDVYNYLLDNPLNAIELYEFIGENSCIGLRDGDVYMRGIEYFQQWYLGEELYIKINSKTPQLSGKVGLLKNEQPILPKEQIYDIMEMLFNAGKILGVGTGRISTEILGPLQSWDVLKFFDKNRLINYTDVINAQKELPGETLTKPNPYMFLKGMLGSDYPNEKIVSGNFDKELSKKTLVVGDAGADLIAAQKANMDFVAVLTGVSGEGARGYFEKNGANYIFSSIADFVLEC